MILRQGVPGRCSKGLPLFYINTERSFGRNAGDLHFDETEYSAMEDMAYHEKGQFSYQSRGH